MSDLVAVPADASAAASATQSRSSAAQRLADVFFSPGRLFAELRDDPSPFAWLAPVLVAAAVAVGVEALRYVMVTDLQLAEFQLEQMRMMGQDDLPPAEQMLPQATATRVILLVSGVTWAFARPFVVGAFLWVLFGVALGGSASYLKHASVAAYTGVVATVGIVVVSLFQFFSGQLSLMLDATVLVPSAQGTLMGALRALSPFSVWVALLLAMGGAAVNRRRGWGGAAAFLLALMVGFGALFGFLAGAFGGG